MTTKKRRRCGHCGLPGHDRRTKHVRRNPFKEGTPVRYELKESGRRADVYILDETQGRFRIHAGTIEGYRQVAPELRRRGLSLDDVSGGSYIRKAAQIAHARYQGHYHTRPEQHAKRSRYEVLGKLEEKAAAIVGDLASARAEKRAIQGIVADLQGEAKGLGRGKDAAAKRARIRSDIATQRQMIAETDRQIQRLTKAGAAVKRTMTAWEKSLGKPKTAAQQRKAASAISRRRGVPRYRARDEARQSFGYGKR